MTAALRPGDRVTHKRDGDGTVEQVGSCGRRDCKDGARCVTVRFDHKSSFTTLNRPADSLQAI